MTIETILKRGNKKTACKHCQWGELEWIKINAGWRLVPFGTNDLSGTIHAIIPSTCTRIDSGTVGPVAAVAPAPVVQTATVDLSAVNARIDSVETEIASVKASTQTVVDSTRIDSIEETLSGLSPAITQIGDKIDTEIESMRTAISSLGTARPVSITLVGGSKPVTLPPGRKHFMFANALAIIAAIGNTGIPCLVGEAGSGKSTVASEIADALGQTFNPFTCSPEYMATDYFGFKDANGKPVDPWGFAEAYENGWMQFLDEIDNSSAQGATAVNSMTVNHKARFAKGIVTRHPETRFVAAANTFGRGADAQYVGRSQLDAATLSRFVYIPFDSDWGFMGETLGFNVSSDAAPYYNPGAARDQTEFADWGEYVKGIRDIINDQGLRALVTPRAMINGAKLLAAGIDRELTEYAVIWAHMSKVDAQTVRDIMVNPRV